MNNSSITDEIQSLNNETNTKKYRLKDSKAGLIVSTEAMDYDELLSLPDLSKEALQLFKRYYSILKSYLKEGISVSEALEVLKDVVRKRIDALLEKSKRTADLSSKFTYELEPSKPEINLNNFILSEFFSRILVQQELSRIK